MSENTSIPKLKHGSVLITLQINHFITKQSISSQVFNLCDKPYPAEKLQLELTGYERLMWEGSDDKSRSAKHSDMIYVKTNTLRIT